MPINRKYNLELLLGTLREELRRRHNYKVLFEYVMLAGINDRLVPLCFTMSSSVPDLGCSIFIFHLFSPPRPSPSANVYQMDDSQTMY